MSAGNSQASPTPEKAKALGEEQNTETTQTTEQMETQSGEEKDHILRHIFKIRERNSENETCWENETNAKINMKTHLGRAESKTLKCYTMAEEKVKLGESITEITLLRMTVNGTYPAE